MNLELVQFPNTDQIILPGLLYSSQARTDRILISLHGNGSAAGFYNVNNKNTFGKITTENSIDFLTFTNTGGHLIQKFDQIVNGKTNRVQIGVAYELINNCIQDINGAIKFVKTRGYKHIYLIGHSTGANKIGVYNYYLPNNEVEKFVLESGGDDSGLYYAVVGPKKFNQVIQKCKDKVRTHKGQEFVPKTWVSGVISYQSLLDQINPDGDYNTFPFYWELNKVKIMKKNPWREILSITKPCLVIYGDRDEYCYGRNVECVDLIKRAAAGKDNFSFQTIKDADHGYTGHEEILVQSVVKFLSER
jgi:pimeloyl-ACP methyl ester carboxylesterase